MSYSQAGLWKIDALLFAAAALAVALAAAVAARADGTDTAAPADGSAALTAASPVAGAKPDAPGVAPSTVWDPGSRGTLGLTEPDRESLNQPGSEDASRRPGAQ